MREFSRVALSLPFLVLFHLNSFAQPRITTYAGPSTAGPVNGAQAVTQSIGSPMSVIADAVGGFYFASSTQHRIYRVAADGTLTVIAGTGQAGFAGDGGPAGAAQLNSPAGIALDAAGNLFIADRLNHRIRQITAAGIISTVSGDGAPGFSGDGEPAFRAQLNIPWGIALDGKGALWIADTGNHRIRKISADGIIRTVAGTGEYGNYGDNGDGGQASLAQLFLPSAVAVDAEGTLFIAQRDCIRKVGPDGVINRFAGSCLGVDIDGAAFGGDGGPAASAQLNFPTSLTLDASGNLFIADRRNHRIRKISSSGIISTVAGAGGELDCRQENFGGDGGPATAARLNEPSGVAVDSRGNLFITDLGNNRIRKVTAAGIINTVAGDGGIAGFKGDGGAARAALLNTPIGVAVDRDGNLFIADNLNCRIRKVTPAGIITTVARLNSQPRNIAVDNGGNLFVTYLDNQIRKISPEGAITIFAGTGTAGTFGQGSFGGDGGPATAAQLHNPSGLAVDDAGNVFIADRSSHRVRKVSPNGVIVTVAGGGAVDGGDGFSGDGGPATSAELNYPLGVAVDARGNLFIADTINHRIRRVAPDGVISTVAGNGSVGLSGDGGPATSAEIGSPFGVAVDGIGNLFISAGGGAYHRIRKVTPDGIITTLAGDGTPAFNGDGGPAFFAQLNSPWGVAVDGSGSLFIADTNNHRIRKVTAEPVSFTFTDRGGMSLLSAGLFERRAVGYAGIQPDIVSSPPAGLAILEYRQNNILVTEASVPASLPIQSGRIYAEITGSINTGLAIANANGVTATVSFFFTDETGDFGHGVITIPPNGQMAAFLNEPPFNGRSSFRGAFTFSSAVPVASVALRWRTNERAELLMTTLPVIDLGAPSVTGSVVLPHFVDGDGWSTEIVLVNRTNNLSTGAVQFLDPSGQSATVAVDGRTDSSVSYAVPPRTSQTLKLSGARTSIQIGSVRVLPSNNTTAPAALALFSFRNGETTITETAVVAAPPATAFRLYAETFGTTGAIGSIRTGLALANSSGAPATVTLELHNLDGSSTGLLGTLTIPANGQAATFLNLIPGFASLQPSFMGIVNLTSTASLSVAAIRERHNERAEILISTTPPVDASTSSTAGLLFPLIVDSGGYTTQLVLFSARAGQRSSGELRLLSSSGGAWDLPLR